MSSNTFWLRPKNLTLRDGTSVTLRPEDASDLELVWEMFSTLSIESLQYLPIRFTRERIEDWFKDINLEKTLPILAFVYEKDKYRIIASSSLTFGQLEHNRHIASFGITVHDDYQGRGLGRALTEYMIEIARSKGIKKLNLEVVTWNERAIKLYHELGFKIEGKQEMGHWNYILERYGDDYIMGLVLSYRV